MTTAAALQPAISLRQAEANRSNAQHSTGPRTEEGKRRSCQNARSHGLTGQIRLLPLPELTAAQAFCDPLIANLSPAGPHEQQLATSIAQAHWRLNRARDIEENLFAAQINLQPDLAETVTEGALIAECFAGQSMTFARLTMYEQRIRSGMHRDIKILQSLQKDRHALEAKALEESKLLLQYARHTGETFDSKAEAALNSGFLYPIDFLEASLLRDCILFQARAADFSSNVAQTSKISFPAASKQM